MARRRRWLLSKRSAGSSRGSPRSAGLGPPHPPLLLPQTPIWRRPRYFTPVGSPISFLFCAIASATWNSLCCANSSFDNPTPCFAKQPGHLKIESSSCVSSRKMKKITIVFDLTRCIIRGPSSKTLFLNALIHGPASTTVFPLHDHLCRHSSYTLLQSAKQGGEDREKLLTEIHNMREELYDKVLHAQRTYNIPGRAGKNFSRLREELAMQVDPRPWDTTWYV